jgi:hypothetical protein
VASFLIGDSEAAEILMLCRIAKHNGSALKLSDLLEATRMAASEEELEAAWSLNQILSSRYVLDSGWILEKSRTSVDPAYSAAVERQSEERSKRNLRLARDFARLCVDHRVRLLAVSGGNSYRRAGPRDDIDLFCVTAPDTLWLFMLKSLLLARLYKLTRRWSPPFCLSYVLDERRARRVFQSSDSSLFARDALMARVLHGDGFYLSLLRDAPWMSEYFPKLYWRRIRDAESTESDQDVIVKENSRAGSRVLNFLLSCTVGAYIRLKARLLNRRLRKSNESSAFFRADVGRDWCIYESDGYRSLRKIYGDDPAQANGLLGA